LHTCCAKSWSKTRLIHRQPSDSWMRKDSLPLYWSWWVDFFTHQSAGNWVRRMAIGKVCKSVYDHCPISLRWAWRGFTCHDLLVYGL
jgi:hypothetical protein